MTSLPPLPALTAQQSISNSELDSTRLKLVQLIDSVTNLLSQLDYLSQTTPEPSTSFPGILPWPELLSRYNLLSSHVITVMNQLSSVGDAREKDRRGLDKGRDPKKEKWNASLVAPAVPVEESKDWIVGLLLRTKQTPQVEAHLNSLVESLPATFSDPSTSPAAIQNHTKLIDSAIQQISALQEGSAEEPFEWKARIRINNEKELEEDQIETEDDDAVMQDTQPAANQSKNLWTPQQVATFLRSGKIPTPEPS